MTNLRSIRIIASHKSLNGLSRNNNKETFPLTYIGYLHSEFCALQMDGIFAMPSRQVLTSTLEASSDQVRRLHHPILR